MDVKHREMTFYKSRLFINYTEGNLRFVDPLGIGTKNMTEYIEFHSPAEHQMNG